MRRQEIGGMRGRRRHNRTEKRNWSQRVKIGMNLIVSALVPLLLSTPFLSSFFFFALLLRHISSSLAYSIPLSSFPLLLFHISSFLIFSVSFSSLISPLSFRLLALFFLHLPLLPFALSLLRFHVSPPPLPSSQFYNIVAFPSIRLPLFLSLLLILILCPIPLPLSR
jgi:hypothetical protein